MKYLFLLLVLWGTSAQAKISPLVFSVSQLESSGDSIYTFSKNEKGPSQGMARRLYNMKKQEVLGNYKKCYELGNSLTGQKAKLDPWIRLRQLRCSLERLKTQSQSKSLMAVLKVLKKKSNWFSGQSYSSPLRSLYIKANIDALEYFAKKDRSKAWRVYAELDRIMGWLNRSQKAEVYSLVGQTAFIQQDLPQARVFYLRSLQLQESEQVRERLLAIQSKLNVKTKKPKAARMEQEQDAQLVASKKERELYGQVVQALQQNDLLSVVEDGVELINRYTLSRWSDWTEDKIVNLYTGLLAKNDGKLALLKVRVRKAVQKLPARILVRLAEKAFWRGYYKEADLLASMSLKRSPDVQLKKKALRLLGLSQIYIGDYTTAVKTFDFLLGQSSGTKEAIEYLFRLGLTHYRLADFAKAIFHFERLLALNEKSVYELPSLYWARNSYIRLGQKEKADEVSKQLLTQYPLTYYGMRVRISMGKKDAEVDFQRGKSPDVQLYLAQSEMQSWQSFKILSEAGWYKAAKAELGRLPAPVSNQEKLLHANLWMSAGHSQRGIKLFNDVLYDETGTIRWNTLKRFFPQWYSKEISKWSTKNSIQPEMIYAIIRQESSFEQNAESSANAVGLMQLIKPTSKEVAKDLKIKQFSFPQSLREPDTNVRMGTYYFRKILKSNGGNVPLTLAAYNAGMGNLYKWIKSRKDLSNLRQQHSSEASNEIWLDELPWSETRFYVQAVMRNYLIYHWLYGKLTPSEVWNVGLKAGGKGPKK